jgi:hypothetical protein
MAATRWSRRQLFRKSQARTVRLCYRQVLSRLGWFARTRRSNRPFEECRRMPRILIIATIIAVTVSEVQAEDVPSSNSPPLSNRGSNFPASRHGSAYPAPPPNQKLNPLFDTASPSLQQQDTPLRTQPEHPNYRSAVSTLRITCSGNLTNTRADGVTLGQCDLNFVPVKEMTGIENVCGIPGTIDSPVENQCRIRAVVAPDPIPAADHGKLYRVLEVWSVDKR